MKRRLATLLRLRRTAEQAAAARRARAAADLVSATERVAEAMRIRSNALGGPPRLTATELASLRLRGLAAHDLVTDARSEEARTQEREAELADAWSMARARRKSVERLSEKHDTEVAAAAARAGARALDELGVLRRQA